MTSSEGAKNKFMEQHVEEFLSGNAMSQGPHTHPPDMLSMTNLPHPEIEALQTKRVAEELDSSATQETNSQGEDASSSHVNGQDSDFPDNTDTNLEAASKTQALDSPQSFDTKQDNSQSTSTSDSHQHASLPQMLPQLAGQSQDLDTEQFEEQSDSNDASEAPDTTKFSGLESHSTENPDSGSLQHAESASQPSMEEQSSTPFQLEHKADMSTITDTSNVQAVTTPLHIDNPDTTPQESVMNRFTASSSSTSSSSKSAADKIKSKMFHQLKPGTKVVICPSPKLGPSDVTKKYPDLDGKTAIIEQVPQYPNTWVTVKVLNGDVEDANAPTLKVRSSNFRLAEKGLAQFVQTERLSKSIFFNRLKEGTHVLVLAQPRKKLPPDTDFKAIGRPGVIVKVPVYPSTWLTVSLDEGGQMIKVRTSQIVLPDDAPEPSVEDLHAAVAKARIKAAKASQQSRHNATTNGGTKRRKRKHHETISQHGQAVMQTSSLMYPQQPQHVAMMSGYPTQVMPPQHHHPMQTSPLPHRRQNMVPTVSQPGWRPQIINQAPSVLAPEHQPQMENGTAIQIELLSRCAKEVLPALQQHPASELFICPVPHHIKESSAAMNQLSMMYDQGQALTLNLISARMDRGEYTSAEHFHQEVKQMIYFAYNNVAHEEPLVDRVADFEACFDVQCQRVANDVITPQGSDHMMSHSSNPSSYSPQHVMTSSTQASSSPLIGQVSAPSPIRPRHQQHQHQQSHASPLQAPHSPVNQHPSVSRAMSGSNGASSPLRNPAQSRLDFDQL